MNIHIDQPYNTKLKVLFCSPSVSRLYTGVYDVQRNLALEFNRNGIDLSIHGLRDKYTLKDASSWKPVCPYVHDIVGPKSIGYSPSYMSGLLASNASVGHVHALWSLTSHALYRWSIKTNKPYLFTANGYLDPWALSSSGFKKKIALKIGFGSVLENAACIQVNSERELLAVKDLGLKNPICVISNGVIIPDLKAKRLAPWSQPITADKKILLYLGRIDNKKGVDLLLTAWSSIVAKGNASDWHLVLVGFNSHETDYEKQIKAAVQAASLNNHVTCLKGQYGEKMSACYQNCSAFISPSFSEGASIAVLSAWAFAKPAIITDECGFPEAQGLGCAVRIEPTIPSIAFGINKCLEMTTEDRHKMGNAGLKLVVQNYSWSVISEKVYSVYKWICSKDHKKPDSIIN